MVRSVERAATGAVSVDVGRREPERDVRMLLLSSARRAARLAGA